MEKGYLEAVQLSVALDRLRPANIVECHTFSFTYADTSDGFRQVNSVQISPSDLDRFSVADAQKSFKRAIRSVLLLAQGLPPLPREWKIQFIKASRADRIGGQDVGVLG